MAGDDILQWNCNGLRGHRVELELLLSTYNPSVVCLQETKLTPEMECKMTFKYYTSYFKSKTDGNGGVGILVKNNILQSQVKLITNLQATAVCVTVKGNAYIICSIYNPPLSNPQLSDFRNLIRQFSKSYLLCGDFNAHNQLWSSTYRNEHGKTLEKLIDEYSLVPLNISENTFNKVSFTPSLIDLTLCHPAVYLDFSYRIEKDQHHSDHHPIFITVHSDIDPDADRIPKWNFKKADWSAFKRKCLEQINTEILDEDVDKMKIFSSYLVDIASECIPKTSPFIKSKSKPWFDEDCINAKRERNKAERLAKRFPNMDNKVRAKLMQARARKLFRQKKRDSWRSYVSSIDSRTSTKKVWNMIRKITGKSVPSHLHHLRGADGGLVTDKEEIANKIAQAFEFNSSSENYGDKFQTIKAQKERKNLNFKTKKKFSYNRKFSLRDLKRSLKKSKNSSPGADQIHYEILKHLPDETLKLLLSLINEHWEEGTFPDCWRSALLLPIPKPGKDHFNPNNYRPIALTSCICKTVERMVNERLVWELERRGLISKLQCGFRSNRGTLDQLVRMETFVRDALENKEHLVAVFFDLQKAYDTTWKYGIMQDLYNHNFRGNLPIFIQNFLSDRVFMVLFGNILSDEYLQEGVPQGAILSTTLFNVKLNEIVRSIVPGVDCSLYVDDFVIIFRSSSVKTIERKLQLCINSIIKWTTENGFTISSNKTVAMHFTNRRKTYDPELKLGSEPIQFVKEHKFLGIIWDPKLKFKAHIDYLRKRCFKALNIIKVVSHLEWGADTRTLLNLYQSLVRSKVDYGSIVYRTADKKVLKSLEVVHNQGLRLCLGAFKSSPIESLNVEANFYPLEFRRKRLSLQYGIKIRANENNASYDCIFDHPFPHLYQVEGKKTPFTYDFHLNIGKANIPLNDILQWEIPEVPIWDSPSLEVSYKLSEFNKSTTAPHIFLSKFREILPEYDGYFQIYTDGSKCNEKTAAAYHSSDETESFRLNDNSSIFTAEIEAIRGALNFIRESGKDKVVIFSDSMSVLEAIDNQESKNSLVNKTLQEIYSLVSDGLDIKFCWIPSHIGIPGNEAVDRAAKLALDSVVSPGLQVPYTDKYPLVKKYVNDCWQQRWHDKNQQKQQKLYEIMPETGYFNVSGLARKEQVIIHRIRIGHTRLTHSFKMEKSQYPIAICVIMRN